MTRSISIRLMYHLYECIQQMTNHMKTIVLLSITLIGLSDVAGWLQRER
jgi:hypothetical protein